MSDNKPVRVASIDAKDLYGANKLGFDYTLKHADGNPNLKRYINALDYSLDLIKLREIYYKVFKNNKFSFIDGKNKYTNQIVNVTFNYSYKLYNKCGKNLYIKDGFSIRHIELNDCACIINGEIAAIEINKQIHANQIEYIENKYFRYNPEKQIYETTGTFPALMNKQKLRDYLYETGFTLDGIEYIRFKRSSGSARVGKCLFINKKLYE